MSSSLGEFCDKAISFLFYTLFLMVPLIFWGNTSELFEFNKLWFTFIITILIVFFWLTKCIVYKRIFIQRTPLDIPILLFLASQTISTLHSIDQHISIWGYYTRFNGGLLSLISYALLYFAFVANMN